MVAPWPGGPPKVMKTPDAGARFRLFLRRVRSPAVAFSLFLLVPSTECRYGAAGHKRR